MYGPIDMHIGVAVGMFKNAPCVFFLSRLNGCAYFKYIHLTTFALNALNGLLSHGRRAKSIHKACTKKLFKNLCTCP